MPLQLMFEPFSKHQASASVGRTRQMLSQTRVMLFWFHFTGKMRPPKEWPSKKARPQRDPPFFSLESNVASAASSTATQEPERVTRNVDTAHLLQEPSNSTAEQAAALPEDNVAKPPIAPRSSTQEPEQATTHIDTPHVVQETCKKQRCTACRLARK